MGKDWIEHVLPLLYASFGAGLIRSMFFGYLRRLFRKSLRLIVTLLLVAIGVFPWRHSWF